jgi:hypothetical protein
VTRVDAYRHPIHCVYQRLALFGDRQLTGHVGEQIQERLPRQGFQEIGWEQRTRAVQTCTAVEPPVRRQQCRLHGQVAQSAVFGVALAARGERVDLHGFADGVFRHPVAQGASVIREVDRFVARVGEVGHGTRIAESVKATLRGHDRVFVISDMQTFAPGPHTGDGDVTAVVPRGTPLYGFNLGGYRHTAFDAGTPNRIEFGGLTDAVFRMIPLIEAGRNADWPF